MDDGPQSIAVIVPVYNVRPYLPELLRQLEEEHARQEFLLVLSDNGSDDGSWEVVLDFARTVDFAITTRSDEPKCAAHARNEGVRQTSAARLLFCDSDDVPRTGWVGAMMEALDTSPFVAGAKAYDRLNPVTLQRVRNPTLSGCELRIHGGAVASGCNFGCHRWVWDRLGGQDVTMPSGSEDADFSLRAKRDLGVQPVFARDAVIDYRLRDGFVGNYRQARSYGRNEVAVYARHGAAPLPTRVKAWAARFANVLAAAVWALSGRSGRLLLAWRSGKAVGRIRGSLQYRVFYP